jgi:hypothetical protein
MTELKINHDIIAVKLDELADLSEYWKKNRSKGLMPNGVRAGMMVLVEEISFIQQQRLLNKDDLLNKVMNNEG